MGPYGHQLLCNTAHNMFDYTLPPPPTRPNSRQHEKTTTSTFNWHRNTFFYTNKHYPNRQAISLHHTPLSLYASTLSNHHPLTLHCLITSWLLVGLLTSIYLSLLQPPCLSNCSPSPPVKDIQLTSLSLSTTIYLSLYSTSYCYLPFPLPELLFGLSSMYFLYYTAQARFQRHDQPFYSVTSDCPSCMDVHSGPVSLMRSEVVPQPLHIETT